jgi:hypothetical protein
MIALQSDCLIFQLNNGESVPCSPEMISVEIVGNSGGLLDPEVLRHAAASVFHYFKNELERETVTVGEFAGALEKVLRRLGLTLRADGFEARPPETIETDLGLLARNPATAWNCFSSRACATNCAPSSANRRACCVFAGCAAASSSWPARNAGARAAKKCRSRSSSICAAA